MKTAQQIREIAAALAYDNTIPKEAIDAAVATLNELADEKDKSDGHQQAV